MARFNWLKWILAIGLLASLGFSRPGAASQDSEPLPPQIILVMDISGSMSGRVVPNPPPAELRALLDEIYAAENLPEAKSREDQLKAILEQPEIKTASENLAQAKYDRQTYIQDSLGVNLFDAITQINNQLDPYNCEGVGYRLVDEGSVYDALQYASNSCGDFPSSVRTEVESLVWFLNDTQVQSQQETIQDLNDVYQNLLTQSGYSRISDELEDLYENSGYYSLTNQLDERAEQLGLPTRLEFAKAAASSILDLIELDYRANGQVQQVGVVTFSTYPGVLQPLTSDIASTRALIEALEPTRTTNLGGGLETALDMAQASPNPTTIILLSDGWLNTGPPRSIVTGSMTERANSMGVRICSAGFGTREEDIDRELLEGLATRTNGKYLFTSSGGELVSFFSACRQSSVAENVMEFQGPIQPGETVEAGQFEIERGSPELTISLNFIEGELDLIITDPTGAQVTADYSGLTQMFSPGLKLWTFEKPEQGIWKVQVTSTDASQDVGVYYVVVSAKPGSKLPSNLLIGGGAVLLVGCCCLTFLLLAGGAFLYFRSRNKKK